MLSRVEVKRKIEERMESLDSSDVCALFLLAIGQDGRAEDSTAEGMENLLSRFFRITEDIVGDMGGGCFAAFLNGRLTENVIWEKARTISEALWFSSGRVTSGREPQGRLGVYLFRAGGESFDHACREAEYALEMARQNPGQHFYIHMNPEAENSGLQFPAFDPAAHLLMNYIDEGVRLLEVGRTVRTVYASPGFYRRLGITASGDAGEIRIHPADRATYEADVREVAEKGGPKLSQYRVSKGEGLWILCRIRLLRLSREEEKFPVVLEISHNITGLELLKSQNDENREWLRYVASQTDCQLWDMDLKTRTFHLMYTRNLMEGRPSVYENFPESVIDSGRIHRDSAERFREFARGMFEGKAEDSGNFMVQYRQSSCYGWASLSYRMLYDANGHPEKAIGIKEDLSYRPGRQARMLQRRPMPADLYPHLYCFLQANLTRDTVEKLQLEGRDQIQLARYRTYTEVIESGIMRLFSAEDGKRLQSHYCRTHLLKNFEQGRRWLYDRCRIVDSDGEILWVSIGANLCQDAESGEVCLFVYMSDEGLRRQWESGLKKAPDFDPETGVYEADTARELIRYLVEHSGRDVCSLVRIQIAGAEELFQPGDRREQDIITALHVFLDTECIVGKAEENGSLMVFFPHIPSQILMQRKIENAFSFVRISLDGMEEMKYIRLVAGVVSESQDKVDMDRMALTAYKMCVLHTGEAADAILFSSHPEEYSWSNVELSAKDLGQVDSRRLECNGIMTEEEKDMALECMEQMLRADNCEDSLNGVLEKLGHYYQADRVYILVLTEKRQTINMLNEWNGKGKYSIQQAISGKRTENFPVIAGYAKHPAPLFLSMKTRPDKKAEAGEKISWQYAVLPMEKDGDTEQMLCIENPRKKIEGTALMNQLIPYLSRERRRFRVRKSSASALDRLYALPNLKKYMDTIDSLNSDTSSSLGVLAMDIPEFEGLKEKNGYEFGSQFLLRLSEVLSEVFGASLMFHTQEAEFIVLCTNVTYGAFLNQCARVRQLMGRKYAGKFRMGSSWSDRVFTARNLVQKARSIMHCITGSETGSQSASDRTRQVGLRQRENLQSGIWDRGKFTVYLQPKIDMQTGELAGAEALVRILDENGELLPHVRIIEEMEQNGTIQELDYFVFDQVLQILSSWKKRGCRMIPVSSNFSRNTLVNPSSLASVLAILSRYPEVPQELTEIEITETAGDFENSTFSDLIRRFSEYGLQFSLDDFGAGYSNISMLSNLHFHSVKLDRSMIRNITENSVSQIMVKDMASLCRKCGLICIAEGVETRAQAEAVQQAGCRYAQGYYYDRPMPLQKFERKYFQQTL